MASPWRRPAPVRAAPATAARWPGNRDLRCQARARVGRARHEEIATPHERYPASRNGPRAKSGPRSPAPSRPALPPARARCAAASREAGAARRAHHERPCYCVSSGTGSRVARPPRRDPCGRPSHERGGLLAVRLRCGRGCTALHDHHRQPRRQNSRCRYVKRSLPEVQISRMRSSSALPTACVRFWTLSLRRIFWTDS